MMRQSGAATAFAAGAMMILAAAALAAAPTGKEESRDKAAPAAGFDRHGDPLPAGARARLGTIRFRSPSPMREVARVRSPLPIQDLVVSPDGKLLATWNNDPMLRLWDLTTGRILHTIEGVNAHRIWFTPDSRAISAHVGPVLGVQMWDTTTGKEIKTSRWIKVLVAIASFSADGEQAVTADRANVMQVWDLAHRKETRQLQWRSAVKATLEALLQKPLNAQSDEVVGYHPERVAMSADGKFVAACVAAEPNNGAAQNKLVYVWETATGKQVRSWILRSAFCNALVFSPDGRMLATNAHPEKGHARDTGIVVWDLATGKELRRFVTSNDSSDCLFSSDNRKLLTTQSGRYVDLALWDIASGQGKHLEGSERVVAAVFVPGQNTIVATGPNQNRILVWDTVTGKQLSPFGGHAGSVVAAAVTNDGKSVVTFGDDHTLRHWDATTGRELRRLEVPKDRLQMSRFDLSCDGRYFVMSLLEEDKKTGGFHNPAVQIWPFLEDKPPVKIPMLEAPLANPSGGPELPTAVGVSADGRRVAAGFNDGTVRVWRTDGKQLRRLVCERGKRATEDDDSDANLYPVYVVQFSADGQTLLTLNQPDTAGSPESPPKMDLNVLELATGKRRRYFPIRCTFENDHGASFEPQMNAAGKYMLLSHPGTFALLSPADGKEIRYFGAPRLTGSSACFSPNGKHIVGGSTDGSIYVWETATGTLVSRTPGHRDRVLRLAFSADGKLLVSTSADTTALVWDFQAMLARGTESGASLSPERLKELWNDLADVDAARADRAMQTLQNAPGDAVALLQQHLKPIRVEAKEIDHLIRDLDSEEFAVRQKATRELEKLEYAAAPALKKALAGSLESLELRRRMETILHRLENFIAEPEQLRRSRAIEVLQFLGTPEAKRLLESLATGTPGIGLTQRARDTLERLK